MRWIVDFFRQRSNPKLKSQYSVFLKENTVATLSEPIVEDQFWVSFRLTPTTNEAHFLDILYNDDSWSKELLIKESDTLRLVKFELQLDIEEKQEEILLKKTLEFRPTHILLRGPYNPCRN